MPLFTAATCAPPAVGFKVIVSPKTPKGGSYAIGAKIHLSCPVGLTILSSALSATCGADGDWSVNFTASEPYCKGMSLFDVPVFDRAVSTQISGDFVHVLLAVASWSQATDICAPVRAYFNICFSGLDYM